MEGPGVRTPNRVKEAPPGSSTGEGIELGGPPLGSSTAVAIDLEGASSSVGPGASIEIGRASPSIAPGASIENGRASPSIGPIAGIEHGEASPSIGLGASIENRRASPSIGPDGGIENGRASPSIDPVAGTDEGKRGRSGRAEEASPTAAGNRTAADTHEGGLLTSAPATPPALKSEQNGDVASTAHGDYDKSSLHPLMMVFCLYGNLSNQPDADITEEPSNDPKRKDVSGGTSLVSKDGKTGSGGGSAMLSRRAIRSLPPPDAVMGRRKIKGESETQPRLFATNAHRKKILLTIEARQRDQKNMAQSVETISTSSVESAGLDKRKYLMYEHKERIRVCEIIGDAETIKAAYKDYHTFLTPACTPASTPVPPPGNRPTSLSDNPVEATTNYGLQRTPK